MVDSKYTDRFMKAIRVFVDHSIKDSLTHEPQSYADALLPAFLPAVKRAIATFMNDFVATLQNLLERSLSARSLTWRLEALRTGKPFAEIVLLHSLIYQVEQVLLIDHESGLLLDHVSIPDGPAADADLVSGMLTALTDFMRDSFQIKYSTLSGTLQYGDHLIWTERGKTMMIAALVRGQPPPELRETLQNALNQIQSSNGADKNAAEYLKPCLAAAYKQRDKGSSHWRYISIGIVALAFAIPSLLGLARIRSKLLLSRYESALRKVPGVVIVRAEIRNGSFYFYGIRDSHLNPDLALQKANLNPRKVILDLQPFISAGSTKKGELCSARR